MPCRHWQYPACRSTGVLLKRKNTWVFVNNHFEGCAPKTIERIKERLTGGEVR